MSGELLLLSVASITALVSTFVFLIYLDKKRKRIESENEKIEKDFPPKFENWNEEELKYRNEILKSEVEETRRERRHISLCASPIIAINGIFLLILTSMPGFLGDSERALTMSISTMMVLIFSLVTLCFSVTLGLDRDKVSYVNLKRCREDTNADNNNSIVERIAKDYEDILDHNSFLINVGYFFLKSGTIVLFVGIMLTFSFFPLMAS